MVHPLLGKILDLPRLCNTWLSIATESPSHRKFGTCHDFLPISQYFFLLQVQSITFFVFGGWQVCYASLIFLIFFISVHLPLSLLVVCNSTHFIMLKKTLQTRSLLDLYFVYLIWNSSFVKVNQHLHRSAVSKPELHWFMFWFLPISLYKFWLHKQWRNTYIYVQWKKIFPILEGWANLPIRKFLVKYFIFNNYVWILSHKLHLCMKSLGVVPELVPPLVSLCSAVPRLTRNISQKFIVPPSAFHFRHPQHQVSSAITGVMGYSPYDSFTVK